MDTVFEMASRRDDEFADQTGRVELLWGTREPARRGPKPVLTIERLARTAVEVADADGLHAVSMQRVAGQVGLTKMALYRYVSDKADLLAIMIELAVGEPPDLTRVRGGWRPQLEVWARRMRETWQRHPWLPGVTLGNRLMGPREIGWSECAVGALTGTGLGGEERMDAVALLSGHIRNTRSPASAGTQPWTTERRLSPAVAELLDAYGHRFPALAAATAVPGSARHDGFEFGLERILDGLQLLIDSRSRPRRPGG
jgi:AcrR family transcriptional regulator